MDCHDLLQMRSLYIGRVLFFRSKVTQCLRLGKITYIGNTANNDLLFKLPVIVEIDHDQHTKQSGTSIRIKTKDTTTQELGHLTVISSLISTKHQQAIVVIVPLEKITPNEMEIISKLL